MKEIAHHNPENEYIVVVCGRVLEIELLLLCHLRGDAMIEEIKTRNHYRGYDGCKDVTRADLPHMLQNFAR